MVQLQTIAESFVSLIFDKRYDDADVILRKQREAASVRERPRLAGLNEALRAKVEQLGSSPSARRSALAGIYMAAYRLRGQEYWNDAATTYMDVIERSFAMNEPFFLNDALLSRAVCLKNLGRFDEYERAKSQVPAGTTILIDGVNCRVEDL